MCVCLCVLSPFVFFPVFRSDASSSFASQQSFLTHIHPCIVAHFSVLASREPLSEDQKRKYMYDLLKALKYMHSAKLVHRDLLRHLDDSERTCSLTLYGMDNRKPANLLLSEDGKSLKVCDFGLARSLFERADLTIYVTTRHYRAPELLIQCKQVCHMALCSIEHRLSF